MGQTSSCFHFIRVLNYNSLKLVNKHTKLTDNRTTKEKMSNWPATVSKIVFLVALFLQCLEAATSTHYGHEAGYKNLFGNPEFESDIPGYSTDSWFALGQGYMKAGKTRRECFSGNTCAYAKRRTASWVGLHSRVPATALEPDTSYWTSFFLKVTEDLRAQDVRGTPFKITFIYKIVYKDTSVGPSYAGLMSMTNSLADNTWRYMASDVLTPDAVTLDTWDFIEIYADAPTNIGYMLDATGFSKIDANVDWRTEAQQNIETYRKADINLRVVIPSEMDPSLVNVQVNQVKNGFPFGSATHVNRLIDFDYSGNPDVAYNAKYRDWFVDHFDWTVFDHRLKWKQMEKFQTVEDDSKFYYVDQAMEWLESHGKKTRGHAIHWNTEQFQPQYIQDMTNMTEFRRQIDRRIDYMTEHYLGRFEHWDVSNEHANDYYFEDKTGNQDIFGEIYARTRQKDPQSLLFTNDFSAIENSRLTSRVVNTVRYLQDYGSLVDGIGLQSHFSFSDYGGNPVTDLPVVKRRLDVFRGLGVPIWITEMDSDLADPDEEAQFFEDMLLMMYGTPEIEGIIFWGIYQFIDDNVENNAVGDVVERLIKTDWRTNLDITPTSGDFSANYRGFHGDYEITTTYAGVEISKVPFQLMDDKDVELIFVKP